MIKVLIVDDSAFMRKLLTDLFNAESDFTVMDTARNGKEAVDKVKRLKPDLVTMDVEMPLMDGITALEQIMRESPCPVVMISSLTQAGADATIRALELGAVDFVGKSAGPVTSINNIHADILEKCRIAARTNVSRLQRIAIANIAAVKYTPQPVSSTVKEHIVAIGTSTGGPRALQEILTKLPENLPSGVVIVQHMPPGFTKSLSDRLNSMSALTVKEAEMDDVVQPGWVFIAPGNYHMILERKPDKTVIKLHQQPLIGGHRPAVDPLMESVAQIYGSRAIGVILTGMGHDGSKGIEAIKKQHGYTIAEAESTTVVFGMPKSAIELGVIDKILPVHDIAAEIVKQLQHKMEVYK